jgi:adenylyltransferase/sulfurtransferase
MKFREFKIRRDPSCPVCGDNPTIFEPIDYEGFCNATTATTTAIRSISVAELRHKLDAGGELLVLDVREPFEFEMASIDGSRLIPLAELGERMAELPKGKETVVLCKSGMRSAYAVELLQRNGFQNAFNLEGGIDAWAEQIDPAMQKY